jgi:hypothetical protein
MKDEDLRELQLEITTFVAFLEYEIREQPCPFMLQVRGK